MMSKHSYGGLPQWNPLDSLDLWRPFVDTVPDVVLLVARDGTIRYINHPPSGLTREALVGTSAFELVSSADRAALHELLARILRGDEAHVGAQHVIFPDETGNWCELHGGPVTLDQETVGAVIVARDVTERRRYEEQMREAGRIDVLGRLAAGIAHDFNNLLAVMTSSAQMILHDAEAGSHISLEAEVIMEACRRGSAFVRQLMTFARGENLPSQRLDMNQVVLDTVRLANRVIDRRISLILNLDTACSHICMNRSQLDQVVMNLILNARDAIGAAPGSITIATCSAHASAVLRVADTGIGMTDTVRQRIFEPMFTTKRGSGSSGLGLATVHGIVAQAGGAIEVESAPGRGSAFEIRLPTCTEDVSQSQIQ
jgi:two-component system, cell cycle sensor histidine kinase and response regulator CckA